MVEGSPDNGNFLVRVRAQVMTRDEYGWVPMGGGGLSNVSVRKRVISEEDKKPEYVICGKRISDQTIVLSCTIKRDFQYNKVMPTFHHWRTGDKKFGLTFQTAADARAFDKGVRTAVEDLLEGVGYGHNAHGGDDLGDDDVFMTLELPVESHSSTGSSSESGNGGFRPVSTTPSLPGDTSSPHQHHLHRIHFMKPSRTMPTGGSSGTNVGSLTSSVSAGHGELQHGTAPLKDPQDGWPKDKHSPDQIELSTLGSYSYVQFSRDRAGTRAATEPEYHYPSMEPMKGRLPDDRPLKKQPISTVTTSQPPLLPSKGGKNSRRPQQQSSPSNELRCRYCLEPYVEEENRPGVCQFSHDRTLQFVNHVTCYTCSQCMLYHCMSDTEGDFQQDPCARDGRCCKRWTALAVLSLFVPCLWCYVPCRACHRCGARLNCWGGKHEQDNS